MSDTQAQVEILDKPAQLTAFDPIEAGLTALRDEAAKTVFDVTTTAGDKAAREFRQRCVSTRTAASDAYENWNKPFLAMQRAAREKRDYILAEVKAIEEPVSEIIKAEEKRRADIKAAKEAAELARRRAIQDRIWMIGHYAVSAAGLSSAKIAAMRETFADEPITLELYGHRTSEATALYAETSAKLEGLQRRAGAGRGTDRLAEERATLERQRQEQEAAAKAAREAEEARLAAERAALKAEQDRLKAERDAENARPEAARAEKKRQRRQEEASAAAARRREEEAAAALRASGKNWIGSAASSKRSRKPRARPNRIASTLSPAKSRRRRTPPRAQREKTRRAWKPNAPSKNASPRPRAASRSSSPRMARRRRDRHHPGRALRRAVGDVMGWMKKFDYTATGEALAAANASTDHPSRPAESRAGETHVQRSHHHPYP